jgi:hypothetical protein
VTLLKVKTLQDNVLTLNKKGTVLEVSEEAGKRLIELKVAEEVKEEKKTTQKKASKKADKEGE